MADIRLKSAFDGFELGAYHVGPADARQGGLVLIQEVFGVTSHIRELADSFAEAGYEVIAPSMYDRLEPGFQADYAIEAVAKASQYSQETPWGQVQGDLQAAIDFTGHLGLAVGDLGIDRCAGLGNPAEQLLETVACGPRRLDRRL